MEKGLRQNPDDIVNSTKVIALSVLELTGASSPIVHEELPGDDPTQRKPDLTLARDQLGWEPTIALREGLERTIPYFRSALGLG